MSQTPRFMPWSISLKRLKADPSAITDVDAFQATMDTFEAPNPYMNGDAKLRYVGCFFLWPKASGRSATGGKRLPRRRV